MINVKNRVDEKSINCTVIVQEPILELLLTVTVPRIRHGSHFVYIAIGENISMEGKITGGTNVSCRFDFGEDVLNEGVNVFQATYAYRQTGSYTIGLTCENGVSRRIETFPTRIVIQKNESITGLQIKVNVTSKGEYSAFTLLWNTGTAFLCDWGFGDGSSVQTDFSQIDTPVLHNYTQEGYFNVSTNCSNRHGSVVAKGVAWVQIPIADLTCDSMLTYVNTSAEASFNVSVKSGSHVTVTTRFESNHTKSFSLGQRINGRKYFLLNHSFASNGSYEVAVMAFNLLGSLTIQCKPVVIVQHPLNDTTLRLEERTIKNSSNAVFILKTSTLEKYYPTDAFCLWSFGDKSPVEKRRIVFNSRGKYIILHRYSSSKNSSTRNFTFTTNVFCSNEVSRSEFHTAVTVLAPVRPVIKVGLQCEHSAKFTNFVSRKYFALGETATMLVTSQNFDKAYRWKLSGDVVLGITKEPCINVTLSQTGTLTASVEVDKVVENTSASVQFNVQEKISGVSFTSSGFTWLRNSTHFEITIPKFQHGSCFIVAFKDSITSWIDKMNCATSDNEMNFTYSFNHTFPFEGNYTVSLSVFNRVSEVKKNVSVVVVKPICKVTNVSIWDSDIKMKISGGVENILQPIKYNRSGTIRLEGQYINHCLLPDSGDVKVFWQIIRIEPENLEQGRHCETTGAKKNHSWHGSNITVHRNFLIYGNYSFILTVTLTGSDVLNLYGQVQEETKAIVEIVPTPLSGEIRGSSCREADTERAFSLHADFNDRDVATHFDDRDVALDGKKDLKFDWYCRTKNQFSGIHCRGQEIGYDGQFVHCLDQKLIHNISAIKSDLNYPEFTPSLERYIANKTYIFTVKVTKRCDGRTAWGEVSVFILPPGPPRMTIRYASGFLF